jgi:hypothetical protein
MKFHQCDTLLDSNIDTDRNFMLKASYGNNGFIPTHIWVWLQGSHLAPRSPGYHGILRGGGEGGGGEGGNGEGGGGEGGGGEGGGGEGGAGGVPN